MTKAELTVELVALGFAPELLENKTNAQLQAMLAEAQAPAESTDEPVSEEVTEVVEEAPAESTDEPVSGDTVMIRNVIHDNKEYKVGQVLTGNDPVRLFVRQGYAQ